MCSSDLSRRPASGEANPKIIFPNGFVQSPYAETGSPGGALKDPPRTLWHASPGSSGPVLPAGYRGSMPTASA